MGLMICPLSIGCSKSEKAVKVGLNWRVCGMDPCFLYPAAGMGVGWAGVRAGQPDVTPKKT